MFAALYTFYGHGQASSNMSDMNSDLIDLCSAVAKSDKGTCDANVDICIRMPNATIHSTQDISALTARLSALAGGRDKGGTRAVNVD